MDYVPMWDIGDAHGILGTLLTKKLIMVLIIPVRPAGLYKYRILTRYLSWKWCFWKPDDYCGTVMKIN